MDRMLRRVGCTTQISLLKVLALVRSVQVICAVIKIDDRNLIGVSLQDGTRRDDRLAGAYPVLNRLQRSSWLQELPPTR